MKWFTNKPPKDGQQFLAKLINEDLPFYVVYYDVCYNPNKVFCEAGGEQYTSFDENEIIAWTTFEELNKSIRENN